MKRFFVKYLLLSLCSVSLISSPYFSAKAESKIVTLKAVTLLNFSNYIDVIKQNPKICIIGDKSLFDTLTKLSAARKKVTVISSDVAQATQCSLVYISRSNQSKFASLIKNVGNKKIVTVSDKEGFVDVGGIFELFEEDGRIRFAVNVRNAKDRKIDIDSRLIEAAEVVE